MSWKKDEKSMQRNFSFKDFTQAFSWMSAVAIEAEKMQHHPQWSNVYNTVEVTLSTHDAGDVVTDKDRKLADIMDAHYARYEA